MSMPRKITIAEPSDIVRMGIVALLRRTGSLNAEISEIPDPGQLKTMLPWHKPDILVISPSSVGALPLTQLRKEAGNPALKIVALQTSLVPPQVLQPYDEAISLYDSAAQIGEKLGRLAADAGEPRRQEPLSQREKEVVACVVKGMTNKQIAEVLNLSAHTVVTHRRNLSAKLGIHSTAGLTIYAIVNRLVTLQEVSEHLPEQGGTAEV